MEGCEGEVFEGRGSWVGVWRNKGWRRVEEQGGE